MASEEIIDLDSGYQRVKKDGIDPFIAFIENGEREFFKAKDFVKLYDLIFKMCFSPDTRLLTDAGFLFRQQIEQRLQAGHALLFACYDVAAAQLLYRPGRLVLPAGDSHSLVHFTTAAEQRRWAPGSGDYGRDLLQPHSPLSPPLSLCVTPEHDVYVQRAGSDDASSPAAPFTKIAAGELVSRSDCATSDNVGLLRMRANAAAGVRRAEGEEQQLTALLQQALGLSTSEQVSRASSCSPPLAALLR